MQKKTKIVATIGPSSDDSDTLAALCEAGVNIIRINFSHGDYEEHGAKIDAWNQVLDEHATTGAVMADLAGPEIRTGELKEGPRSFAVGDRITLTTEADSDEEAAIYVNYAGLPADVSVGDRVLIDDGRISFNIVDVSDTVVVGEVTGGGRITAGNRGVSVPGVPLSLPSLIKKDAADLKFAVEKKADFIAASFVKSADDITQIHDQLVEHGAEDTKIVAKIETQAAVDHLREIVTAADAVMVARGDLAVEVSLENVPMIQKQIITTCNAAGVPVITATQMLESMTASATPTRAEASDVANAILDGSDAVMLSGETAVGKYPIKSVEVMTKIASMIEVEGVGVNRAEIEKRHQSPVNSITASVVRVAEDIEARAIVALTDSGFTARMISRYRPTQDILAFSPFMRTVRQLSLSYGCDGAYMKEAGDTEAAIKKVKKLLSSWPDFKAGDKIVIAVGLSASAEHLGTNALLIAEL